MFKAFFFDLDGVLYNSMPSHAQAWEEVMRAEGLHFTARDCYLQEGRTGQSVITEAILRDRGYMPADEEWRRIYEAKTNRFHELAGTPAPVAGVQDVLAHLKGRTPEPQIFIVTGSGQQTLFDSLEHTFPGVFRRERMVTAFDYTHGKPDPEPYLMAWERSGLPKEACCVIENAPLGIRAGKGAGLYTIGVNTGPLLPSDLKEAGADRVFDTMHDLLGWLQS